MPSIIVGFQIFVLLFFIDVNEPEESFGMLHVLAFSLQAIFYKSSRTSYVLQMGIVQHRYMYLDRGGAFMDT